MKKNLLFLLIILPVYLLISLYYLDKHYFLCPIDYKGDFIIRSDSMGDGLFGSHRKGNRLHQGIDFFAPVGTPILASRSGIVISTKRNPGMGNYIIIRHSPALITIYGHLSRIYVTKGKFVRQGEIIGAAGKTGNANYQGILSHLHFEIRKNGIPQDPLEYLE